MNIIKCRHLQERKDDPWEKMLIRRFLSGKAVNIDTASEGKISIDLTHVVYSARSTIQVLVVEKTSE
jgi:hypothetical protein